MSRTVPMLLWSAAAVMVAVVVHIGSILVMPMVATDTAFSRLAAMTGPNVVSPLPAPSSRGEIIPFRDPALASAVCRYDLTAGPLRIAADVGDAAFMAVSFHGAKGVPFYALTNRSGNEGQIELLLLTPAQLEQLEAQDAEDEPVREVRITAPDPQGFVEFDVLPRIGGSAIARQSLALARCRTESGRP